MRETKKIIKRKLNLAIVVGYKNVINNNKMRKKHK